ncbi:pantoate--beta-alanine ligase [compost metagenome]
MKDHFEEKTISELLQGAKEMISEVDGVELDYFTIANGKTLLPENNKNQSDLVALVAAKVGQTRLIDNMLLN